ncbi:MAG: alpha/beta hydrolase [Flavobacteriales bacterium]|nr:alpha/beta hydrolase [Flavobacteriales bacterium]
MIESESDPEIIKYGKNDKVGRYALVNGIWMYYEEYGEGFPLLILHGNGSSIASQEFQIQYFSRFYRVILADSRGHGRSEMKTIHLTYEQMADDWLALYKHLEIESAYLLGWSDGGILALLMAIRSPDKVKAMVCMGSNTRPRQEAMNKINSTMIVKALEDAFHKSEHENEDGFWARKFQQLQLLYDQPEIPWEALEEIKCPALILAGEKDSIKKEHTEKIANTIPGAKCFIFEGMDHYMPVSQPDEYNLKVHEFLKTCKD